MKFILDHYILISVVLVSGGALLWPMLSARGKKASTLEVTQMINRGKTTVLDVRDEAEFAKGHLRDAKNIPLAKLSDRIAELEKVKNRTVVVVCQNGNRSAQAISNLQKAGIDDVYHLEGGLTAWQAANLPLIK